jgi:hypothetical protein
MDSDILASRTRIATTAQGATGYLTIDLAALGRNYRKLVSMLGPVRAGAVVKADAYGLAPSGSRERSTAKVAGISSSPSLSRP